MPHLIEMLEPGYICVFKLLLLLRPMWHVSEMLSVLHIKSAYRGRYLPTQVTRELGRSITDCCVVRSLGMARNPE